MEVEDAIVVHTKKAGENASTVYVLTEAEKISAGVVIDALPYVDTEVCWCWCWCWWWCCCDRWNVLRAQRFAHF